MYTCIFVTKFSYMYVSYMGNCIRLLRYNLKPCSRGTNNQQHTVLYTIVCRMYENDPGSQFEMHAQGRTDTIQALVQYVLLTIGVSFKSLPHRDSGLSSRIL